jgi:nucleotide-binding universal stress UspA family protein
MKSNGAPIERILLPTDFSEFSSQALRHALALARKFKARLNVVYVIPQIYPVGEAMFVGTPWLATPEVRKRAEEDIHAFMASAREARIDYGMEIREGDPWREILDAAEELPADLVVMGTHGRSGPERFFLGSVTEKLVRCLPCPVMTVSHEEARTWEAPGLVGRILCATDFSESSDRAFDFSLALAARNGAKVTLLHVIEYMPDLGAARYRMVVPDPDPLRAEIERGARERLERAIDRGRGEFADVDVTPRAVVGRAYKEILRVATDERADLIVIGAQGHGLVEHILSGSNAQHVIRKATCPVLTVRPLRTTASAKEAGSGTALAKPLETHA